MERTHRWAERALVAKEQYRPEQTLFGIVQGAFEPDTAAGERAVCGQSAVSWSLDWWAIGW